MHYSHVWNDGPQCICHGVVHYIVCRMDQFTLCSIPILCKLHSRIIVNSFEILKENGFKRPYVRREGFEYGEDTDWY